MLCSLMNYQSSVQREVEVFQQNFIEGKVCKALVDERIVKFNLVCLHLAHCLIDKEEVMLQPAERLCGRLFVSNLHLTACAA